MLYRFSCPLSSGFRLPGLMVRSCNDWLVKNPKGAKDHRIILLDLVTNLIQEKREAITPELAQQCIELGMEEMVRDKASTSVVLK